MKDLHKNPVFYYVLVPCVLALWPLLVWFVHTPGIESEWNKEEKAFSDARKEMDKILSLDPGRLDYAGSKEKAAKFDYSVAIDNAAGRCGISPSNYKISSGLLITSKKQKSQSAMVILEEVDIASFSKFLAGIQLQWSNLECKRVKLTRKKGAKDLWKVDLDFKYYF